MPRPPDGTLEVTASGGKIECDAVAAQFDATVEIHPTAAEEFVTLREETTPK